MSLIRLLKRRLPGLVIICGGSACAGRMGPALLRICPYVDIVVGIEAERTLPELVRRIRSGRSLDGMPGVLRRGASGGIEGTVGGPLYIRQGAPPSISFDQYFERLSAVGLDDRIEVWLPFESSRGCWWGEKRQCTFCGLHEIMQFRNWSWESVLQHLEALAARYRISRFFAVDLIMPRDFLQTLLPEIIQREHDWSLFYEIKANLKRAEVETLAAAGVRWIQPGIESLDDGILKLMDKGVAAMQNVQLLKWCREIGIQVTWNFITEIPGESPEAYSSMAQIIPSLHHLDPPSGASPFQLHRFSPFFENPERYGITRRGAHPLYKHIFPVEQGTLDDLVYLHDYSVARRSTPQAYTRPLKEMIGTWRSAHQRGAALQYRRLLNRQGEILDSRSLPSRCHRLTSDEAVLYEFLDSAMVERKIGAAFARAHPEIMCVLERTGGIGARLGEWQDLRLVLKIGGRVVALATRQSRQLPLRHERPSQLAAPVTYLD